MSNDTKAGMVRALASRAGWALPVVIVATAGILLLLLPFVALFVWALWGDTELGTFRSEPTSSWLEAAVTEPENVSALIVTLGLAAAVTPVAVLIGSALDFSTFLQGRLARAISYSIALFVMMFPPVLYALSIRVSLVPLFKSSLLSLYCGQVILMGSAAFLLLSSLQTPHRTMAIDAGRVSGATTTHVFWYVDVPLRTPALVAAFLLTFAMTIDESVLAVLVLDEDLSTVPRLFWQRRDYVGDPSYAALAVILVWILGVVVTALLAAYNMYRRHSLRRRFS